MTNGGVDAWGMIDALKSLGALDDDQEEHVATVGAEMNEVLADRDNPDLWRRAAGLWNAQFDDPDDGAYCQAWNDLSGDDRKALQVMAAKSVDRDPMLHLFLDRGGRITFGPDCRANH